MRRIRWWGTLGAIALLLGVIVTALTGSVAPVAIVTGYATMMLIRVAAEAAHRKLRKAARNRYMRRYGGATDGVPHAGADGVGPGAWDGCGASGFDGGGGFGGGDGGGGGGGC